MEHFESTTITIHRYSGYVAYTSPNRSLRVTKEASGDYHIEAHNVDTNTWERLYSTSHISVAVRRFNHYVFEFEYGGDEDAAREAGFVAHHNLGV